MTAGPLRPAAAYSRADAACVFLILLLCFGWFLPKTGDRDWVANSRAALVYAIADQGVLYIDAYHETTGDKAFHNGRYYTVASIGPSLIALPAYAVFRELACSPALAARLCPSPPYAHNPAYAHWALVWITFWAVSLPSAAIGVLVYVLIGELLGLWRHAFWLALVYGLGTVAFPYSRAFYQHQVAAFGLAFGFYVLWRVIHRGASLAWLSGVGLLFGLAIVSEYPLVLPVSVLVVWALVSLPRRAAAAYHLLLGVVPLLLVMAAYDMATFDTPFPIAYRYHEFHSALHGRGVMGVSWPSLEAFYGITLSPLRGLFFMSPFLLLMLPGIYWMWRGMLVSRTLALALAGIIVSFFLYNSGYLFWTGGYSIGPRYLVPMLPFAMLPVAAGVERGWRNAAGRILVVFMCAASLVNVWAQSIAGQYYPPLSVDGVPQNDPLLQHAIPHLRAGDLAINWGHRLGLTGWWTLLPLAAAVLGILLMRRANSLKVAV
jgi:hypothetical protein